MNLTLTDHLMCPACQAAGGLILLADRVEGRRVLAGRLGCPECRTNYRVADGVAEFAASDGDDGHPEVAEAGTLAALLGVTEGPAMLLMVGPYERVAAHVGGLLSDVEIIVATRMPTRAPEREGLSVLQTGARVPLRDRSMRGVMITGSDSDMIGEAVRVAGLAARVVLLGATAESTAALRAAGVHVVAEQDDTLVAVRHF